MANDFELTAEIVPDESALEELEDQEIGLSGDGGNAKEIKDLNEEQAGRLAIVGRTLGRLAPIAGKIAIIAGLLAVIAKVVGSVFDIGFGDVRSAIVNAINTVVNAIIGLPGQLASKLEDVLTFNLGGGTETVAFNPTASFLKPVTRITGQVLSGKGKWLRSRPLTLTRITSKVAG